MSKKKSEGVTPEGVFRRLWFIWDSESPRIRGRIAFCAAEKEVKRYCETLSSQALCQMMTELDTNTAYYAYYLELLYTEQESIGNELSKRAKQKEEQ